MFRWPREKLIDSLLKVALILLGLGLFLLIYYFAMPALRQVFSILSFIAMPFVLAWLVGLLVRPLIDFLQKRLRFPRGLAVFGVILAFFTLAGAFLSLIISRLISEIAGLSESFPQLRNSVTDFYYWLLDWYQRLDLGPANLAKIQDWLLSWVDSMGNWLNRFLSGTVSFVQSVPGLFLFAIIFLVALFFWCRDGEKLQKQALNLIPQKHRQRVGKTYLAFCNIVGGYCRAVLFLISITTLICIIGYAILGVEGAIGLGLLTGLCDILPILGPGTIIVPWLIWSLIQGNYFLGFGLLILYAIVIIIRNLIEPKIVGDRIGLHPLASLAALFVGLQLFGVIGLALGPILLALILAWQRSKSIDR
ncbi:MAG: sporulation integral membrane protein YtvI [Clostridiales bacterium]|nr:sporulation integral membrane protein YtvI [Clostridiales bacterium]